MLPPVSVPRAKGAAPAATAAAEPPLLPPGTREVSQGLRVGKKAEFSVEDPMPNSSMLPLPSSTAPCSRSRATAVASYTGMYSASIRDAQVVAIPLVQSRSLICMGTPVRGDASPAAMRRSASVACWRARSAVTVM